MKSIDDLAAPLSSKQRFTGMGRVSGVGCFDAWLRKHFCGSIVERMDDRRSGSEDIDDHNGFTRERLWLN